MSKRRAPFQLPAIGQPVGPMFAVEVIDKGAHAEATNRYNHKLAALRDYDASGVYCIMDHLGRALYVGESHTGRLYDTITRHFRKWDMDPRTDAQGRRRGGTTYDRQSVLIAYTLTTAADAPALQYAEIQRLRPRDNSIDCTSESCADAHDIPF